MQGTKKTSMAGRRCRRTKDTSWREAEESQASMHPVGAEDVNVMS
jgi:hypothetical protein